MIWLLELPVFLLGFYHSKKAVFASGMVYTLFCLCFRKYAVKGKSLQLNYPILSITAAVGLAVLFCREWMAYSVSNRFILITACLLALFAIHGIDTVLYCLSQTSEYRTRIYLAAKKCC